MGVRVPPGARMREVPRHRCGTSRIPAPRCGLAPRGSPPRRFRRAAHPEVLFRQGGDRAAWRPCRWGVESLQGHPRSVPNSPVNRRRLGLGTSPAGGFDCNLTAKRALIDPVEDDPLDYLDFSPSTGRSVGLDKRGVSRPHRVVRCAVQWQITTICLAVQLARQNHRACVARTLRARSGCVVVSSLMQVGLAQ